MIVFFFQKHLSLRHRKTGIHIVHKPRAYENNINTKSINNKYGIMPFFIGDCEMQAERNNKFCFFFICKSFADGADLIGDFDDTPDNQNQIHAMPEIIELTDLNEHYTDEVHRLLFLFFFYNSPTF